MVTLRRAGRRMGRSFVSKPVMTWCEAISGSSSSAAWSSEKPPCSKSWAAATLSAASSHRRQHEHVVERVRPSVGPVARPESGLMQDAAAVADDRDRAGHAATVDGCPGRGLVVRQAAIMSRGRLGGWHRFLPWRLCSWSCRSGVGFFAAHDP